MSDDRRPTVLIVHGDPSTAERYADWLTPAYETRVASPGDLPGDPVDVVVLDWGLDRSVRRRILEAEAPPLADVAVLAVDEGIPETDPVEAGADDCLLPPVTMGELRAAVETVSLTGAYQEWLDDYLDSTADAGDPPPEVAETVTAMDATLSELVETVPYPTLFRSLLDEPEDEDD